jgi:hypothetical protein
MIERDIVESDQWFTGEDKNFNFTIYQADGETAQNITSWTLSWMLKKDRRQADSAAKLTKTTENGGIEISSEVDGRCTVVIEDTDTDTEVPAGVYWHELKRTNAGNETIITQGKATIRKAVHQ